LNEIKRLKIELEKNQSKIQALMQQMQSQSDEARKSPSAVGTDQTLKRQS